MRPDPTNCASNQSSILACILLVHSMLLNFYASYLCRYTVKCEDILQFFALHLIISAEVLENSLLLLRESGSVAEVGQEVSLQQKNAERVRTPPPFK